MKQSPSPPTAVKERLVNKLRSDLYDISNDADIVAMHYLDLTDMFESALNTLEESVREDERDKRPEWYIKNCLCDKCVNIRDSLRGKSNERK